MRRFSFGLILTFCGLIVFACAGYILFLKPQVQDPEGGLAGKSAFEKGEYYFNHDDSPDGEYDIELAKQYYRQATTEEPKNELVWYQLGRIYFIEGSFNEALEAFQTQVALFDDAVPNVYYMIGLTHGFKARRDHTEEDWRKAEEAFVRFIEHAPSSPYPRVDLAWVYFSQGKFLEMLAPLEEGLVHAPENPWLLNMYGLALLNTGKREEALAAFYKARDASDTITVEDWGRTYPGNDPALWDEGLAEFRSLIEKNISLTEKQ